MNRDAHNTPGKIDLLLLKGGRIIDPASGMDEKKDILIKGEKIEKIGSPDPGKAVILDCSDKIIVPGLMDMHVHLREPGNEDAETIASGCRAAMAGGFTGLCAMPNTHPAIDNRGQIEFVMERARNMLTTVYPVGAVTVGQEGEQLTEMGDMADAGAVAFTDDGYPVRTSALMRRALEYARMFGTPIINHCEELSLTEGRVMNEGVTSTRMGLRGIPSVSEDIMVARDLMLAEYTGGPLHIAHVSTGGAVRLIREAKMKNVNVTAETCPHYLVLTETAVAGYNTNAKMKPPLRTEDDRQALLEGLADGTIDVIATDHAPHVIDRKDCEFNAAAFGIIGMETAAGVVLSEVVDKRGLDLKKMVRAMSTAPRKILGLPEIVFREGENANCTVIDPERKWVVESSAFLSKSRNTPFDGWELKGRAVCTVNNGMVYSIF